MCQILPVWRMLKFHRNLISGGCYEKLELFKKCFLSNNVKICDIFMCLYYIPYCRRHVFKMN